MATEKGRFKLASACPGDTNVHYLARSGQPGYRYIVEEIVISNLAGTGQTFRLYHCKTGDAQINNNVAYDTSVGANSQIRIEGHWYLNGNETIGVRSSLASNVAFSIFGIVEALTINEAGFSI